MKSLNLQYNLRKMDYEHIFMSGTCLVKFMGPRLEKSKLMFLCYMSWLYAHIYMSLHVKPVGFASHLMKPMGSCGSNEYFHQILSLNNSIWFLGKRGDTL